MLTMAETIDLQKFVGTVIVVGIILVMGMFILSEIGDNTKEDVTTTTSTSDADVSFTDKITLTAFTSYPNATCSEIVVTNSTGEETVLATGNYTVENCVLTVDAGSPYQLETVDIAYDYTYTAETNSEATNASENLVTSLSNGTGWIAILIVVGFATIILALLSTGLAESMKGTREQPIY